MVKRDESDCPGRINFVVQLPGVHDERAKELIGRTALQSRLVRQTDEVTNS